MPILRHNTDLKLSSNLYPTRLIENAARFEFTCDLAGVWKPSLFRGGRKHDTATLVAVTYDIISSWNKL
jgi:hypothetical protein